MRLAVWSALTLALLGLGIADAVAGIAIPTYLWVVVGIVIAGLIVGAAIRRPVWGLLGHPRPGVRADVRAGRDVGQPPRRIR